MAGKRVAAAGPFGSRATENPRLRTDSGFVVERAGRHDRNSAIVNTRQRTAANATKNRREAFGFRHLVAAGEVLAGCPRNRLQPQDDIAGVRTAAGLAAALAMAVVEASNVTLQLVGHGTAQATAG